MDTDINRLAHAHALAWLNQQGTAVNPRTDFGTVVDTPNGPRFAHQIAAIKDLRTYYASSLKWAKDCTEVAAKIVQLEDIEALRRKLTVEPEPDPVPALTISLPVRYAVIDLDTGEIVFRRA